MLSRPPNVTMRALCSPVTASEPEHAEIQKQLKDIKGTIEVLVSQNIETHLLLQQLLVQSEHDCALVYSHPIHLH